VVRAHAADAEDRLICPICWAAGDFTAVMEGRAKLERGTRIDGRVRFLVDKARFPKPAASATGNVAPAGPPSAKVETADLATAGASQGLGKTPPERG